MTRCVTKNCPLSASCSRAELKQAKIVANYHPVECSGVTRCEHYVPIDGERTEVINQVLASIDPARFLGISPQFQRHQFLIVGLGTAGQQSLEHRIGYCVQVRKACGRSGSDKVFIRHPSGELVVHEDQVYYAMSEQQVATCKGLFKVLPGSEPVNECYPDSNQVMEAGFVIEGSRSKPAPIVPLTFSLMSEGVV